MRDNLPDKLFRVVRAVFKRDANRFGVQFPFAGGSLMLAIRAFAHADRDVHALPALVGILRVQTQRIGRNVQKDLLLQDINLRGGVNGQREA